ncbi:MAG TPA: hypothetical protein VH141_17670 [Pseudonocardia sp.]|jgi:hypothetical protein|nr:hypothetical protein [Pseudonocardia sp.]
MSGDLVTRAQLAMLAETLGVPTERIRHLERLGAEHLRALRERISEQLFDEQAATFARMSRLAPLVPNGLVAKVSQAIVPPLVAGRAAGALGVDHPGRAKGVLADLSPQYMADCAPYLDQRTVAVLAPSIPPNLLIPAANELMKRRAYVTASWFLDYATPEALLDLEAGIPDKAGLLHTTSLVQSTERLNQIIRLLPTERVAVIVRTAIGSPELLTAGLSLLARLAPELTADLGDLLFEELDADGLTEVLRTVVGQGAVVELLVVAAAVREDALRRIAADPYLTDPATVDRFLAEAAEHDEWDGLLRVAEYLPDELAARVAEGAARARAKAS